MKTWSNYSWKKKLSLKMKRGKKSQKLFIGMTETERKKKGGGGGLNVCIQQYGTEFKIAIVIIVIQNSEACLTSGAPLPSFCFAQSILSVLIQSHPHLSFVVFSLLTLKSTSQSLSHTHDTTQSLSLSLSPQLYFPFKWCHICCYRFFCHVNQQKEITCNLHQFFFFF